MIIKKSQLPELLPIKNSFTQVEFDISSDDFSSIEIKETAGKDRCYICKKSDPAIIINTFVLYN
jgi:hypothetical protein